MSFSKINKKKKQAKRRKEIDQRMYDRIEKDLKPKKSKESKKRYNYAIDKDLRHD